MKCALIAVLLAGTMTGMHCSGQSLSTARSSQFPRFRLRAGQVDADGLPTSGAKLCLLAQQNICYQMPSETYPNSAVTYQFGLEPRSERLTLVDGGSWVFFSAMFSGGCKLVPLRTSTSHRTFSAGCKVVPFQSLFMQPVLELAEAGAGVVEVVVLLGEAEAEQVFSAAVSFAFGPEEG